MADQNENMIFNIIRKSNAQKSQQAANKRQMIKEAENKAKEVSKEFLRNFTGKVEVVLDSGILSYTRLLSVAESKHASLIALPTSGKISFFALDVLQYSNVDVFICKF